MASALFKLSSNGGTSYATAGTAFADANALAYVSTGTYSIKAALDSTAGVDSVAWSITSADDINIASLPAVTSNADKTCTFSVPKTGGAWLLQCTVNGGVNARTGKADTSLTRALAVKVLNSAGNQEVAVGETVEAGTYGWTKAFNTLARTLGGTVTYSTHRNSAAAHNAVVKSSAGTLRQIIVSNNHTAAVWIAVFDTFEVASVDVSNLKFLFKVPAEDSATLSLEGNVAFDDGIVWTAATDFDLNVDAPDDIIATALYL